MSSNKYRPHIVVIPEDKANQDLANGFLLHPDIQQRAVTILPPAGGWLKAVDKFVHEIGPKMREYKERRVVLLLDFDDEPGRLKQIRAQIADVSAQRVFVIGVLSEPEKIHQATGKNLETIGLELAEECHEARRRLWAHELLDHNAAELERLASSVMSFLFSE